MSPAPDAGAVAGALRRLLSLVSAVLVLFVAVSAAAQISSEFDAISAAADGPDAIPSMVFGERDLDAIVALAERVETGDGQPWSLFREASAAEQRGDLEGAADALDAVLRLPTTGSGVALWTWSNLRRLGFEPVASIANQVQGVVYEKPLGGGVEYLAAYADGRWRILSESGTGIFWEETSDPEANAITGDILATAQRLSFWAPNTVRRDPNPPKSPRITLLTWAGMRQIVLTGPLNAAGTPTHKILGELSEGFRRLQDFAAEAASGAR